MPDEVVTIGIEADVTGFKKSIQDAKNSLGGVGAKVKGETKEVAKSTDKAKQSSKQVGANLNNAKVSTVQFMPMFGKIGKTIDGMKGQFAEAGKAGKLAMAGVGIAMAGAVAGIVIEVAKEIWEGVKKLVAKADPIGFEKVMSGVMASVNKLKSALGTALMPLFLEMSVAIKYIADGLTLVIEGIVYIRSLLFGILGINIQDMMSDVADSMEDASESATNGLASFDKLSTFGDLDVTGLAESERIAELTQEAYEYGQKAQFMLGGWVSELGGKIGNVWKSITNGATNMWNNIVNTSKSIADKLYGIFNGIWNGLTSAFKSVANGIIKIFNKLIDGYNSAVGGFSIDVMGYKVGFPTLKNIPQLAKGDVIEPRDPHAVIVGDNTREREVVSPLSTIEQAVENVLSRSSFGAGRQTVELVINLDSRQIARTIYDPMKQEARRRGKPNSL